MKCTYSQIGVLASSRRSVILHRTALKRVKTRWTSLQALRLKAMFWIVLKLATRPFFKQPQRLLFLQKHKKATEDPPNQVVKVGMVALSFCSRMESLRRMAGCEARLVSNLCESNDQLLLTLFLGGVIWVAMVTVWCVNVRFKTVAGYNASLSEMVAIKWGLQFFALWWNKVSLLHLFNAMFVLLRPGVCVWFGLCRNEENGDGQVFTFYVRKPTAFQISKSKLSENMAFIPSSLIDMK